MEINVYEEISYDIQIASIRNFILACGLHVDITVRLSLPFAKVILKDSCHITEWSYFYSLTM